MPVKRTLFLIVAAALVIWLRPWRALARRLQSAGSQAGGPNSYSPGDVTAAWRPAEMGVPAAVHPEAAFPASEAERVADSDRLSAALSQNSEVLERAAREQIEALAPEGAQEPVAEFGSPIFFGPGEEEQTPEPDLIDDLLAQDDEAEEAALVGALEADDDAHMAGEAAATAETAGAQAEAIVAEDPAPGATVAAVEQPAGDEQTSQAAQGTAEEAEAPAAPAAPDDLIVIEGIGPRTSTIVTAAGITTFAQLADADVAHLRAALADAGIHTVDPSTWPDQARLAADGRWDELKELQGRIKHGRMVGADRAQTNQ